MSDLEEQYSLANPYRHIGIIGIGIMGSSIAQQLKSHFNIHVFDKEASKPARISGIKTEKDIPALINGAGTIVLAVKPQDLTTVLNEIGSDKTFMNFSRQDILLISIAAGISTATIEKTLGVIRVIRVMPNIGLKIGEGVACLAKGKYATEEDFDFAENLFAYMGETLRIEEGLMNAATAVSGSGPGFFYDMLERNNIKATDAGAIDAFTKTVFIPELESVAQYIGFSEEEAGFLALTTAASSVALLKKSDISPAELKKQVASKGGTTEAGLLVLEQKGGLEEAVKAALKRAQELERE